MSANVMMAEDPSSHAYKHCVSFVYTLPMLHMSAPYTRISFCRSTCCFSVACALVKEGSCEERAELDG